MVELLFLCQPFFASFPVMLGQFTAGNAPGRVASWAIGQGNFNPPCHPERSGAESRDLGELETAPDVIASLEIPRLRSAALGMTGRS